MARTYGVVNLISSFGFCRRWRRQCVEAAGIEPGMTVIDLMTGMGECWPFILRRSGGDAAVHAVDFSAEMCGRANQHAARLVRGVRVYQENALATSLPDDCADRVVACFGLKTLARGDLPRLADEVRRLLKPAGRFACLEISVPPSPLLRSAYMLYLRRIIPLIGWLCLGNPDNYRLLGVYTAAFGDCRGAREAFARSGLTCEFRSFFAGCATAIFGAKPGEPREQS